MIVLAGLGRSHLTSERVPLGLLDTWLSVVGLVWRRLSDPIGRFSGSNEGDASPIAPITGAGIRLKQPAADSAPELSDFVGLHYFRLIRLAGLITRNTADAEDAVQTALERAWKARKDLRDPATLKQWLDRIVVREASRISSSRIRRVVILVTRSADSEEVDMPDHSATNPLRLAELRAGFAKLSAAQRAVVGLHLYAGYSVAETADLVGAPVETVRSRLRLARQLLRRELEAPR